MALCAGVSGWLFRYRRDYPIDTFLNRGIPFGELHCNNYGIERRQRSEGATAFNRLMPDGRSTRHAIPGRNRLVGGRSNRNTR